MITQLNNNKVELSNCAHDLTIILQSAGFLKKESTENVIGRISEIMEEVVNPFVLAVLGEFRSGKSTLINALIEKSVALMDEMETTSTLNEFIYSVEEFADFQYVDGHHKRMNILDANSDLGAKRHDEEWLKSIKQVSFGVQSVFLSETSIWDAPGLFGSEINDQLAKEFAKKVDAIIWVFDVNFLGEARMITNLEEIGKLGKSVIGVLNKADELDDQQIEKARNFVKSTYNKVNFINIIATNALSALPNNISTSINTFGSSLPCNNGIAELKFVLQSEIISKQRDIKIKSAAGNMTALAYSIMEAFQLQASELRRKIYLYEDQAKEVHKKNAETSKKLADILIGELKPYLVNRLVEQFTKRLQNADDTNLKKIRWQNQQANSVVKSKNISRIIEKFFSTHNNLIINEWQSTINILQDQFKRNLTTHELFEFLKPNSSISYTKYSSPDPDTIIAIKLGGGVFAITGIALLFQVGTVTACFDGGALLAVAAFGWVLSEFLRKAPSRDDIINKSVNIFSDNLQKSLNDQMDMLKNTIVQPRLVKFSEKISTALIEDAKSVIFKENTFDNYQSVIDECDRLGGRTELIYNRLKDIAGTNAQIVIGPNQAEIINSKSDMAALNFIQSLFCRAHTCISIVDRNFTVAILRLLNNVPNDVTMQMMVYDEPMSSIWHNNFLDAITQFRKHRTGTVRVRIPFNIESHDTPLKRECWIFCDGEYAVHLDGSLSDLEVCGTVIQVKREDGSIYKEYFEELWDEKIANIQVIDL